MDQALWSGRRLLLDSNLLLLLLVGLFDKQRIPQFKRTSTFTVEDFELLSAIVDACRDWPVTTTSILTEVSNLSGQLTGDNRRKFFILFADKLKVLDELQVSALDASTDQAFVPFGLTDAGVCRLSEEHSFVVVTTDYDLCGLLAARGVEAINFNHLRSTRILS